VGLGGLLGGINHSLWDMRGGGETVVDFTGGLPVGDIEGNFASLPGDFAQASTASDELVQLVFDIKVATLWLLSGCTTSSAPEATAEVVGESGFELLLKLTLLLAKSHADLDLSIIA
jgi:hypothetical protein